MRCGLFDEVGVDEEEVESDSERACSTPMRSKAGRRWGAVGVGDGVVPEAGGAVAALGRPDAAGVLADVADVGV